MNKFVVCAIGASLWLAGCSTVEVGLVVPTPEVAIAPQISVQPTGAVPNTEPVLATVPLQPALQRLVTTTTPHRSLSDIVIMNADGSGYQQLTDYGYNRDPIISPDGRYIAYRSVPATITSLPDPGSRLYEGSYNLWVITADGAQAWKLTEGELPRSAPQWSPDSRRLIFSEGAVGKVIEITVETQAQAELLTAGGLSPRYRPIGDGIAYLTPEGGLAWRNVAGVQQAIIDKALLPEKVSVQDFDWMPDGSALVYTLADVTNQQGPTTVGIDYSVWLVTLDGRNNTRLAENVHSAQVSPDGSIIAVQMGSGYGDACMVDMQLAFLTLWPNRRGADLIAVGGFDGMPQDVSSIYPSGNVIWLSPQQVFSAFGLACAVEREPFIYSRIDVVLRQATLLSTGQ